MKKVTSLILFEDQLFSSLDFLDKESFKVIHIIILLYIIIYYYIL